MTLRYSAQPASPYLLMGGYGGGQPTAPNPLDLAFAPTSLTPQINPQGATSVLPPTSVGGFQLPDPAGITEFGADKGIIGALADKSPTLGGGGGGGLFGGFLGTTDANNVKTEGWGTPVLGAVSGALNTYLGMKQYGLAKDKLAEGKREYDANYAAQKQTTNASLEDRQRARLAANPGGYESVGSYMNKNGIK